MQEEIIKLLNEGAYFKDIFEKLKCTDEQFLKALSEQQEMEFTTVIHNDPNYSFETVAF